MTPKPFEPAKAAMRIAMFGYHHVDRDTDMDHVREFAENNGLAIEDVGAMCTVTLVPAGKCTSGFDWETYRKQRDEKRVKKAVAKKKKQLNDTTP